MSKYFSKKEISCHCGCGQSIENSKLMDIAEFIRQVINKPMNVHCVNRCPAHNKEVGGVSDSAHTKGEAMDFHVVGMEITALHDFMKNLWNDGTITDLGLYDWGCHIGIRQDKKYFWDNRKVK